MGPGSGCSAQRHSRSWLGRCWAREPWHGARPWGALEQGAQLPRHVPDRSPQAPAQFRSSQTRPRLGLPPPAVPPLTLATASSEPVRSAMPQNTGCLPTLHQNSGGSASPPQRQLAPEKGRSLGTAGHPLTAPLRSSPRLHQAGRRPTRRQVYGADRVTRQAARASGVGGRARVERAQGRGDPSPVRPQGNRAGPTAVRSRSRTASQGEGGRSPSPPRPPAPDGSVKRAEGPAGPGGCSSPVPTQLESWRQVVRASAGRGGLQGRGRGSQLEV